jgi:hypothetical protein
VRLDPDRLVAALLSNLDVWIADLEEIHEHATPGNKRRALHLQRNMLQTKLALKRMIGKAEDE